MSLVEEIETLILEIETHYPELYVHLDEAPIGRPSADQVTDHDLKNYLDNLREQLNHYKETHEPSGSNTNKKAAIKN